MSSIPSKLASHLGLKVALLFLVAGLLVGGSYWLSKQNPTKPPLDLVKLALQEQDTAAAIAIAEEIPAASKDFVTAWISIATFCSKKQEFETALFAYRQLAEQTSNPQAAQDAIYYQGEMQWALGRLEEAAATFESLLKQVPDNAATHDRLAFLYTVTGQTLKAQDHYFFLVKSGTARLMELALLGDFDRIVDKIEFLKQSAEKAAQDRYVRLGLASDHFANGEKEQAETELRALIKEFPDLLAAQAMLGELLLSGDSQDFIAWHSSLPPSADKHPVIWFVRGMWLMQDGNYEQAGTCYLQAVKRAPTFRRAVYQLSKVLEHFQDPQTARVKQQAQQLIELTQALDDVLRNEGHDPRPVKQVALLLEDLGRIWEACGWAAWKLEQGPPEPWAQELFARYIDMLDESLPLVLAEENLGNLQANASFQPFEGFQPPESIASTHPTELPPIQFSEETDAIDFQYDNGADPQTTGARQFEQTGGGIAVVDYDLDGRPDLFMPQGGTWQTGKETPSVSKSQRDALFRNTSSGTFINVQPLALPFESDFGQGCAMGDFNNDGFPDLYVANIGRNRLYENQGDGTFLDVTSETGIPHQDWTTSTLMVDLNADGNPDIVDVNYVQGPQVYTKICDGEACSPKSFQGVPDRLLVNDGTGGFTDVPIDSDIKNAKGLGIITIPTADPLRPALFIANDQVANFMLKNSPAETPQNIQLTDDAFLRGVAFDRDGMAMACMGIATDDIDGNGTMDLFVTNFKDESNTLYLQDEVGLFSDVTIAYQLRASSLPYVGWGTQFVDANLDGASDLVVANGHVDDYRPSGGLYHMPTQVFRNNRRGALVELDAAEAGPFFGRKVVGRSVVRLDWNQDGRMDIAVSCIEDSTVLLTNVSPDAGDFLNIKFHATQTARDAVGTKVVVRNGTKQWTKTLTAGDGYMASNERMLQFGLGRDPQAVSLTVFWPSGSQLELENVPANATLELTEGHTEGTLWQNGHPRAYPVTVTPSPSLNSVP